MKRYYKIKLSHRGSRIAASRERGFALPLTLVLLLVMTLAAVATLRTTTLEENMSANSRLRQVALNAAESALVEAERLVARASFKRREAFFNPNQAVVDDNTASLGDSCTGGLCTPARFTSLAADPQPHSERSERWEDPNLDVWNTPGRHFVYSGHATSNLANEGAFEAPKYIVEFMGNYRSFEPTERFTDGRITVRATAGVSSRQSVVFLQSTIVAP